MQEGGCGGDISKTVMRQGFFWKPDNKTYRSKGGRDRDRSFPPFIPSVHSSSDFSFYFDLFILKFYLFFLFFIVHSFS